jgi:nicotinate-nucleotide pyrophosphorylase (carboxylating)
MDFNSPEVAAFIIKSLQEDIGDGDHSSLASIPEDAVGQAKLLFKEDGVLAGIQLASVILKHLDRQVKIDFFKRDGDKIYNGDIGLLATGNTRALLAGERLLLNCMQRLSGIATITRKLVEEIDGTGARILDTRKTTPGLRFLEKWAVTMGGGFNHRHGLYDMIMLKDNHVDHAGGIEAALNRTREYLSNNNLHLKVEIETRNLEEVAKVLEVGGADRIMFDNFEPDEMRKAVKLVDGKLETEASGGIHLGNIRAYAETGVDFISVGALTHSVKSLDISFKQV